jgi:hypothetical protein
VNVKLIFQKFYLVSEIPRFYEKICESRFSYPSLLLTDQDCMTAIPHSTNKTDPAPIAFTGERHELQMTFTPVEKKRTNILNKTEVTKCSSLSRSPCHCIASFPDEQLCFVRWVDILNATVEEEVFLVPISDPGLPWLTSSLKMFRRSMTTK